MLAFGKPPKALPMRMLLAATLSLAAFLLSPPLARSAASDPAGSDVVAGERAEDATLAEAARTVPADPLRTPTTPS